MSIILVSTCGTAIRALEKGLELEPDNALFSENLRTLREQAAAAGSSD